MNNVNNYDQTNAEDGSNNNFHNDEVEKFDMDPFSIMSSYYHYNDVQSNITTSNNNVTDYNSSIFPQLNFSEPKTQHIQQQQMKEEEEEEEEPITLEQYQDTYDLVPMDTADILSIDTTDTCITNNFHVTIDETKTEKNNKRSRHTNSRYGCTNCKLKRIKCDETLPECNNCRNAKLKKQLLIPADNYTRNHNKKPCSFTEMTPLQLKKLSELQNKNRLLKLKVVNIKENVYPIVKKRIPVFIPSDTEIELRGRSSNNVDINGSKIIYYKVSEIPMIPHYPITVPAHQKVPFGGVELKEAIMARILYQNSLSSGISYANESTLDVYLIPVLHNLENILKKKLMRLEEYFKLVDDKNNISYIKESKYIIHRERQCLDKLRSLSKTKGLSSLRTLLDKVIQTIETKNTLVPTRLSTSLCCISSVFEFTELGLDMGRLTEIHYTSMVEFNANIIKSYISNAMNIEKIDKNPYLRVLSFQYATSAIYYPRYPVDCLIEFETIIDMFAKDFILGASNTCFKKTLEKIGYDYLLLHDFFVWFYSNEFFQKMDTSRALTLPVDKIIELIFKFNIIIPGEAYCISSLDESDKLLSIKKVYYSFYHTLGTILVNMFPEIIFLQRAELLGPSNLNGFTFSSLFKNLPENSLKLYAEYSFRAYSFLRRRWFIIIMFPITNLIPDGFDDKPEQRYRARVLRNLKEVPIKSFTTSVIKRENYFHVDPLITIPEETSGDGYFYVMPVNEGAFYRTDTNSTSSPKMEPSDIFLTNSYSNAPNHPVNGAYNDNGLNNGITHYEYVNYIVTKWRNSLSGTNYTTTNGFNDCPKEKSKRCVLPTGLYDSDYDIMESELVTLQYSTPVLDFSLINKIKKDRSMILFQDDRISSTHNIEKNLSAFIV
ncbi:uncharacterized protein SCODWIG_00786 [Saccharomycodes ludwigii]|uniref:Zn(2)-C6 fungal-type domain-containing protein n=1 Tax=Saccharomycodes ludwigii TaxID=36035 RepID=A0A376B2W7_9ASCO|nr:uncharacterized protein SCODWIG_00786 [Saccharomycodes ludwigii]